MLILIRVINLKLKKILFILILLFLSSCTSKDIKGLKVSYIDVGEGDSILIQYKDKNFLIDGGPLNSKDRLEIYLKKQGVKKIDCLFITHPHEDHIGGLPNIIDEFKVSNIYTSNAKSSAPCFFQLQSSINKKNIKVTNLLNGAKLIVDKNLSFNIISPEKEEYDNLNNYSLVINLKFLKKNFLFMGDGEKEIESNILSNYSNLKCDVLKIGHHGSSTSTTLNFIGRVNPKIGIISCGLNNSFGHPSKITLEILKKRNINFFRTDIDGTIELYSDGYTIKKD